jgi:hypothetical protein
MKFPLAYSIKNGLNGLSKTVSGTPCRVFAMGNDNNNVLEYIDASSKRQKKMIKSMPNQNAMSPTTLKFPSPHDLGIHRILKPLRPLVAPLVDTFSKVCLLFFRFGLGFVQ